MLLMTGQASWQALQRLEAQGRRPLASSPRSTLTAPVSPARTPVPATSRNINGRRKPYARAASVERSRCLMCPLRWRQRSAAPEDLRDLAWTLGRIVVTGPTVWVGLGAEDCGDVLGAKPTAQAVGG